MPTHDHVQQVQSLFVRHSAALRGYIGTLEPDWHSAQDILQETFLTVTAKAASFQIGTDFLAWAYRIACYKVLERARARGSASMLSPDILELLADSMPRGNDVEEAAEALQDCMARLSASNRRLLLLRYEQDHKPAAIAQILKRPPESVYASLSRLRAILRQCIDRQLGREVST